MMRSKSNVLCGLFSKLSAPQNVDWLADEMTGVRFSTSSFERFGDRNHLKGKEGKTIRLKWLSKNGAKLDTFASDFVRSNPGLFSDEFEVIEYIVQIITQYPSGINAYFKARIEEEIQPEAEQINEDDLANEVFENQLKKTFKSGVKTKRKVLSKQSFSKEYMLLKRLMTFHNKTVKVNQLNKLSIDLNSAMKGKLQHKRLIKKLRDRVDFALFKLDQVKTIKEFKISNELFDEVSKVVIAPKVLKVELGEVKQKSNYNLGELLYGVETYTKAEAKELGLLDKSLAGTGKPRNPYDVVNRIIINQLNKGVVPWEMPWTMDKGKSVAPQNYGSKRDYRGINFWNLICEMDMRNHQVPYFLTSKQISERGGKLAKGAKPYYVTYYGKFNVVETEIDKETGDADTIEKAIRFLKLYAVYNIEDTDISYEKPDNKPAKQVERIASAEAILEGMPRKPKIKFGGNEAFYSPSQDLVQMPKPENFKQIDRYYSTFFHELVHSTKSDKRCGTDHFRKNSKAFGDKQYSWEELVAELGASYLCSEAGILHKTVGQSAAYIKGWAKSLQQYIKDDKTYFFKAANYAQKAADFILNKANQDKVKGLSGSDPIIEAISAVFPKATIVEIPAKENNSKIEDEKLVKPVVKNSVFTKSSEIVSGGTYTLPGDIGKFLGNLGEIDCSMSIRGDQGAGKSQLMWILIDAFAGIGKRVAVLSNEISGASPVISKYRDKYIKPEHQDKILFTDQNQTVKQLKELSDEFDVLFVDSFNNIEDYEQNQFKWLAKAIPTKTIVGLFQSTTGGEMRGGNRPEFDAFINIEVVKVDDSFVNNYAVCTKNRFGSTGGQFNISKQKLMK